MRLLPIAATTVLVALSACRQPEPEPAPAPTVAPPAPAAPLTPEQSRQELQIDSAQRQIEAQMQAQMDAQTAAPDTSDH